MENRVSFYPCMGECHVSDLKLLNYSDNTSSERILMREKRNLRGVSITISTICQCNFFQKRTYLLGLVIVVRIISKYFHHHHHLVE